MKAIVLNGIGQADRNLDYVGGIAADELRGHGCNVESTILRDLAIAPCMGCFGCWVQTPGVCLIDDAAREVTRKMIQSHLVVYLTPITFGSYSSDLKKVLDRSIGLISPFFTRINGEVHHRKRYAQAPKLLGVGIAHKPVGEGARIFEALIARNAINMHNKAHAACVVSEDQSATEMHDLMRAALHKLGIMS